MKVSGDSQIKTFLRYLNPTAESTYAAAKKFGSFVDEQLQSPVNILSEVASGVH